MNRLKNLCTVPTTEKVTEKSLFKALAASVISILLCMTCLVTTTWAWFSASVVSEGNIIAMGNFTTAQVITKVSEISSVSDGDQISAVSQENFEENSEKYTAGTYQIEITNAGTAEGYCQVIITPAAMVNTAEAQENAGNDVLAESRVYHTIPIPQNGAIQWYMELSEDAYIQFTDMWGRYEPAEGEQLLGENTADSFKVQFSTVSGGDIVADSEHNDADASTVSGNDITYNKQ